MTRLVMLVRQEGGAYGASFPDFPGATIAADDLDSLYRKAPEALASHIDGMGRAGEGIPAVRSLAELRRDPAFREGSQGALISLVEMDLPKKVVRANAFKDHSGSGFL